MSGLERRMDVDFLRQLTELTVNEPRSIRSLWIPASLKILVLGPHPDDFDAVGVTLYILKQNGNKIDVGVVRSATGVEDSYRPRLTPEARAQLRENEQLNSCLFFGLSQTNLTFLNLDEDEEGPVSSPKNLGCLRDFLLPRLADIVFLPHGNDTNGGHRSMYAMISHLASVAGYPLVLFLSIGPRTIRMRIDAYTEFGEEEANWKARLLRIHGSQQHRNLKTRGHGFDERILGSNRKTAQQLSIGFPYAEAFQVEFYGLTHRRMEAGPQR
jgi:LmbE family N-acetylglucosaminyl deacetylase